jgi:hypothetical protein
LSPTNIDVSTRVRRLELLIGGAWLAVLVASLCLWHRFLDPAALPQPGSWPARALELLRSVPYADPALIARVRATRIAVITTFGALGVVGFLERRRVAAAVARFLAEPSHPINLAIFRIVLAYEASTLTYFDYVARIAGLPAGLQFPPATTIPNIGPLARLAFWPRHVLTPEQVLIAGKIMVAACFTGMLGIFSRSSLLVVAVTLFYGWGTIQWYGKIDHHHHVLWFALVLAASPCGDVLSIDALVRKWRRRRQRRADEKPPAEDIAYGLPLHVCMLLMGVLYFFPGFWKIWRSGFDWFLGENPFNQTYIKWHMLGKWMPPVRPDHFPVLMHAGALGTILFELSFIFLIFTPATRILAGLAGVTFHTSLNFFMRHGFETLRNSYVIFVDWHALARRLRQPLSRRRPSADIAGSGSRPKHHAAPVPDRESHRGLGDLVPLLSQNRVRAVAFVGAFLVAANAWAGAMRMMDAWPIACYPLFDGLIGDSYTTLLIKVVADDGTERTLNPADYRDTFGDRWEHMLLLIIDERHEEHRRELLRLVWEVMAREDPSLAQNRHIRFFTVRSWIRPEEWGRPPGDPELIYEVTL